MGPKMGSVSPGHYADLVVLISNPLDDIGHTSDIKMVFKNGILDSREAAKALAQPQRAETTEFNRSMPA